MTARLSNADALRFILAGNAKFTLRNSRTGNRFTFRVRAKRSDDAAPIYFVQLLTGPDNSADFEYLGYIRGGRYQHGDRKSRIGKDAPSATVALWFFPRLFAGTLPDAIEIWHEGTCGRCGRALTVPESIAAGLGPECAGRAA